MKNLTRMASNYWELLSFLSGWILLHPVGQLIVRWMRS